jgi:hypothetical protein
LDANDILFDGADRTLAERMMTQRTFRQSGDFCVLRTSDKVATEHVVEFWFGE